MVERWCLNHSLCVGGIHTVVGIHKEKVNITNEILISITFPLSWDCSDKTNTWLSYYRKNKFISHVSGGWKVVVG